MNDQNLKPFQPGNKFGKGRIKGSLNKKTYLTLVFQWLNELDEQERQRKNEIRREKRRAKQNLSFRKIE